jgi:O-antigen/teichoic acid export membrane protein
MPFVMRTAMIYLMGVQYLGLDSLFVSVLQVLNLAELGVGAAMVYGMYKPIVDDDTVVICALMKLYRTYYRIIGAVIAVVGFALSPFIPMLIKSNLPPELNIYWLYWLNLSVTVLSYWLFAYKNALFQAHQRTDIVSKISLFAYTLRYAAQLLVMIFIKDYYLYIIAMLATQVLINILTAIVANREYPDYKAKGKLDKERIHDINRRIRDLFTAKLGTVIINSADTVVISAFLGLTILAVYQNYFFILTSIIGVLTIIFQSVTAGIGNSIIVETPEKNFNDFNKFTFLIAWLSGIITCCLLCLYQPFMEIWVGNKLMLDFSAVICFCIYFFVYEINTLLNTYKDAAGMWHEDRFRPLVTALSNLVMNLIMVQFLGIYGVLLSTVISTLFIGMPWLIHNIFNVLYQRDWLRFYVKKLLLYTFAVIICCAVCYFICIPLTFGKWLTLIVRLPVCVLVPNIIIILLFRKTENFKMSIKLIDNMTKGKTKILKKFS